MINFRVIDVANGSEPPEHETLEDAIEAARKLDAEWIIEDFTGEIVWTNVNEYRL